MDPVAILSFTVALSVLLHGMSAGPAARWYGVMTDDMGDCPEKKLVGAEPFAEQSIAQQD